MTEDWLAASPAHGGRRFGPLPDHVRIGTDPNGAQIVASHASGLPPVAIELTRTRNGWAIDLREPGSWSASIRPSEARDPAPRPVRPGSRLEPGDTLILRADLELELTLLRASSSGLRAPDDPSLLTPVDLRPARASATQGVPPPGHALDSPARAFAQEASRQASARLIAGNPVAIRLDALGRWLTQGGWKSPTFVVSALIVALGGVTTTVAALAWLFAGSLR